MTARARSSTAIPSVLDEYAREIFRREPLFASAALVLIILLAPLLVAYNVDERLLSRINIWTSRSSSP